MKTPPPSPVASPAVPDALGGAAARGAQRASPAAAVPEPVLDADVLAWLDEAISPAGFGGPDTGDAPQAAAQARVKKRLLRRIAAESTPRHLTVAPDGADAGAWLPFGPGVTMKVLHRDGATLSYLLRLQPGAALPPHRHPQDEECLVLEGEMHIGEVVVPAGGYHLGRRGVLHDRLTAPNGALIFLRGAEPEAALAL